MADARRKLRALLIEHSIQLGNFTLASGATSSVYLDVRKTALRGDGATFIGDLLLSAIEQNDPNAEAVGGMTLGADPLLTAITIASHRKSQPLNAIIVRKDPKGHGTQNQLEIAGAIPAKANIAVVDDVITSAGSTIKAIHALRESGFHVEHAFCVVDREAGGRKALAEMGVSLTALFSLSELNESE